MNVQLARLEKQHNKLHDEIEKLDRSPFEGRKLAQLKKEKLAIKDQIHQIKKSQGPTQ